MLSESTVKRLLEQTGAGWRNDPRALKRLVHAIEAAALEQAAKVCEARYMGDLTREDMEARRCADAIRALMQETPK